MRQPKLQNSDLSGFGRFNRKPRKLSSEIDEPIQRSPPMTAQRVMYNLPRTDIFL